MSPSYFPQIYVCPALKLFNVQFPCMHILGDLPPIYICMVILGHIERETLTATQLCGCHVAKVQTATTRELSADVKLLIKSTLNVINVRLHDYIYGDMPQYEKQLSTHAHSKPERSSSGKWLMLSWSWWNVVLTWCYEVSKKRAQNSKQTALNSKKVFIPWNRGTVHSKV